MQHYGHQISVLHLFFLTSMAISVILSLKCQLSMLAVFNAKYGSPRWPHFTRTLSKLTQILIFSANHIQNQPSCTKKATIGILPPKTIASPCHKRWEQQMQGSCKSLAFIAFPNFFTFFTSKLYQAQMTSFSFVFPIETENCSLSFRANDKRAEC